MKFAHPAVSSGDSVLEIGKVTKRIGGGRGRGPGPNIRIPGGFFLRMLGPKGPSQIHHLITVSDLTAAPIAVPRQRRLCLAADHGALGATPPPHRSVGLESGPSL